MKVAIVGSRNFDDLHIVRSYVDGLEDDTWVISGGARGVDEAAEKAARKRGLPVLIFSPNWHKHGRRAGLIRNQQIVDACDTVAAFWDGKSRGTKHTIRLAEKVGKLAFLMRPETEEDHEHN